MTTNVRIKKDLYDKLTKLSYKNEMSRTAYINKLLEEAIKNEN